MPKTWFITGASRALGAEIAKGAMRMEDGTVAGDCEAKVETERSLSQLLRRSRPLYFAPRALHARVAAAVEQQTAPAGAREGFSMEND